MNLHDTNTNFGVQNALLDGESIGCKIICVNVGDTVTEKEKLIRFIYIQNQQQNNEYELLDAKEI